MQRTCRIDLDRHLPAGLRGELAGRFGTVDVQEGDGGTALCGLTLDQAGLRALLGLLWDAGLEVTAVTTAERREHQP